MEDFSLDEPMLATFFTGMQLVFASILGFVLFNELPEFVTSMDAVNIVGFAVYITHIKSLVKRLLRY